ncbi:hypothetical protein [Tenacibaculum piscium]|uniref:hypothetical protein n=1 Tax=Tenacibaculum piscium TaxID=1458515 RepID=UPI001F4368A4|nr:hypothetical protein [Tenacibaculum piscium]
MTKYLASLLLILFIGCNESETIKRTYFGGKIINPKVSYIILSDNYNFKDTIYLKKDNSFLASYKSFKKGLYKFQHGPEYQDVYLEPKDSLLLRLNTWDFDESLVFSGIDAERNNLLIEAFLQTEQDNKDFLSLYNLNQQEFLSEIKTVIKKKEQRIEDYKKNSKTFSNDFSEILKIALLYPIYTNLEEYAIRNFNKKNPQKLVDSYFEYRKNTNTKKDSLIFFSPYYGFVVDKFYNDVYLEKGKTANFIVDLLNNIDANVGSEEIKNKLLYHTVIRHFFNEPNQQNKEQVFFTFFKLNSNIEHKKNIQRLINDLKLLKTGDKLPDFTVINASEEQQSILKIIKDKNAVILFKDYKYESNDAGWLSSRTNYLIKNNPKATFIVINLCDKKNNYTKDIDVKHQYTLPKKSPVYNFSSSNFPRIVLVDKKGVIKNGYTSLSSNKVNNQISNLQKK